MVKKELIDYIRTYVNKGYPTSYIRNYLINYGYGADEVDNALRYIEQPAGKSVSFNIAPMLKFIIPIIIVLAAVAFLIPTVMLKTPSQSYPKGNNDNIVIAPPTNVEVPEPVVPQTNSETPVVDTPINVCPANCDDGKECTRDYCSENTGLMCVHQPIRPCCGNGACESGEDKDSCAKDCTITSLSLWDQIEAIKVQASTDPSVARKACSIIDAINFRNRCYSDVAVIAETESYCDDIKEGSDADSLKWKCYSNVAKAVQRNNICDRINDEIVRDECYMNFVLADDYTVCDKIINEYQKQNCNQLKNIKGIMANQPEIIEQPVE